MMGCVGILVEEEKNRERKKNRNFFSFRISWPLRVSFANHSSANKETVSCAHSIYTVFTKFEDGEFWCINRKELIKGFFVPHVEHQGKMENSNYLMRELIHKF